VQSFKINLPNERITSRENKPNQKTPELTQMAKHRLTSRPFNKCHSRTNNCQLIAMIMRVWQYSLTF